MIHVSDELELFALGALAPLDHARVVAHLALCPACREQARAVDEVVQELPDVLPLRDVPERLRARILQTARTDLVHTRRPRFAWVRAMLRPSTIAIAALSIALLAVAADDIRQGAALRAVSSERDALLSIAEGIREGGRWWYMAGNDTWTGSGGTLIAPRVQGRPPFVVFHDLHPLAEGQVYAVWLVNADGTWVRGANFRPDGKDIQAVDVTAPLTGSDRCAVTIEESTWGRRAGPVVMESRILPPSPQ
jgi:hypothetical protein